MVAVALTLIGSDRLVWFDAPLIGLVHLGVTALGRRGARERSA